MRVRGVLVWPFWPFLPSENAWFAAFGVVALVCAGEVQLLAAGADDGTVRLFAAESASLGLQYAKSMPAVEGRLLCAAWHPSAAVLVTGTSVGKLHAWDVQSGQEALSIVAGELNQRRCIHMPRSFMHATYRSSLQIEDSTAVQHLHRVLRSYLLLSPKQVQSSLCLQECVHILC